MESLEITNTTKIKGAFLSYVAKRQIFFGVCVGSGVVMSISLIGYRTWRKCVVNFQSFHLYLLTKQGKYLNSIFSFFICINIFIYVVLPSFYTR